MTKQGNGFVLRADVDEVQAAKHGCDDKGRSSRIWIAATPVGEDNVPQNHRIVPKRTFRYRSAILVDNSGSIAGKAHGRQRCHFDLVRCPNSADAEFVVNFSGPRSWIRPSPSDMNLWRRALSISLPKAAPRCTTPSLRRQMRWPRHASTPQKQVRSSHGCRRQCIEADAANRPSAVGRPSMAGGIRDWSPYEDSAGRGRASEKKIWRTLSIETGVRPLIPRLSDPWTISR